MMTFRVSSYRISGVCVCGGYTIVLSQRMAHLGMLGRATTQIYA